MPNLQAYLRGKLRNVQAKYCGKCTINRELGHMAEGIHKQTKNNRKERKRKGKNKFTTTIPKC